MKLVGHIERMRDRRIQNFSRKTWREETTRNTWT